MEGVPSTSKYNENRQEIPSTSSKYVENETAIPSTSKNYERKKEKKNESTSKYNEINRDERKTFACSFCTLNEKYDYKGKEPPFQKYLIYLEECYIMRDPFTPLKQREALVLGSDCYFCKKPTCMDCSLFYTKRFCKNCALANIQELPKQLHKKIKQFSNDSNENTLT